MMSNKNLPFVLLVRMRCFNLLFFLFIIKYSDAGLWKNGVVHYSISNKDYDVHSQDEITSTFSRLQSELCVKFFSAPPSFNASNYDKILFIHNPDKQKNCPSNKYDYSGKVIYMVLGYKCINTKEIGRNVAEMLRASIEPLSTPLSGTDNTEKPKVTNDSPSKSILTADERNYLNLHYHQECGSLFHHPIPLPMASRRTNDKTSDIMISEQNLLYYQNKLWPLGILMFGIDPKLRNTRDHETLLHAMAALQLSTCIVTQEWDSHTVLTPKNLLWFGNEGSDAPQLGFAEGNQSVSLHEMVNGAPGHTAHALNNLLRALGVSMMSNRYDRDNYITVQWKKIDNGKEHFLEKAPFEAWVQKIPYDFSSASHAPANYMCSSCTLGQQSVTPVQDPLWQFTLAMGHQPEVNEKDSKLVNLLYNEQCSMRG